MSAPLPLSERFRHLVSEAHRRSLWQVLAVYGVASWICYEVILGLTEGLGLPSWVPGFAVVLFVIGLPVVLATACVQERPAATGAAGPGSGPSHPAPVAPDRGGDDAKPHPLTWPRFALGAVATFAVFALAVAAFMGMRVLGIGPPGTLVAKGMLDEREPLVVADFDGLTGDSALALVVAEGLRADLAQSAFVTAVDRSRVRETLELMLRAPDARLDAATAREVAVRMGLKAVVEGEVGRAGAGYLLTARVVTGDSARTLASFRETAADSTELLPAIERLSRALRQRVGESLTAVRASAPLWQVTTSSLPALRKAAEAWTEEARQNRTRAIRLMNEAVELDPGFSSAWAGLAVMHYNRGDRAATLRAIRKALEHEERLSERQRHETRGLHAAIVGDLAAAEVEQSEVAALVPTDPVPHVRLSDIQWNRGEWAAAAAHAARALELGSSNWVAHWNLVVALLDGGDLSGARRAAARAARALPPGHDIPRQLTDMVLANAARYDSVHALNADRPVRAAMADRVLGRWAEAQEHARQIGNIRRGRVLRATAGLLIHGDPAAGDWLEARVDSLALDQGIPERVLAELAVTLAMAGRLDAARRARDAYLARVPEEVRWGDAFLLHSVDAFIALDRGRGEDALSSLRAARASTPWPAPVDAFLGRAYETIGLPDSAIAAYVRYVETPWSYRVGFFNAFSDPLLLVPIHERLARVYQDEGDLSAAGRHAAVVVELWGSADPELGPTVARARRILALAAGEPGDREEP